LKELTGNRRRWRYSHGKLLSNQIYLSSAPKMPAVVIGNIDELIKCPLLQELIQIVANLLAEYP